MFIEWSKYIHFSFLTVAQKINTKMLCTGVRNIRYFIPITVTLLAGLYLAGIILTWKESEKLEEMKETLDLLNTNDEISSVIGLNQEDPKLIEYIRKNIIKPSTLPYKPYTGPYGYADFSEHNQPKYVFPVLPIKHNGFFVEVGANDGETMSNTYYFERIYNWTGLLIECLPEAFKKLRTVHRKAYVLQACLCPKNMSYMMPFVKRGNSLLGGVPLSDYHESETSADIFYPCFPLYSILAALDLPRVDFLSLDIEGAELNVLRTLPWEKLNIRVAVVEHVHVEGEFPALQSYMEEVGYETVSKLINDGLFVKKIN